jgi:hypothetical protein
MAAGISYGTIRLRRLLSIYNGSHFRQLGCHGLFGLCVLAVFETTTNKIVGGPMIAIFDKEGKFLLCLTKSWEGVKTGKGQTYLIPDQVNILF